VWDREREKEGQTEREGQTEKQGQTEKEGQTDKEREQVPGGSEVIIGQTPKQPNMK
jgi:hypothetical protein